MINVESQSVQSVLIRQLRDGDEIALGTAFVVEHENAPYLITNRHNVTGRDSHNQPVRPSSEMPDSLRVYYNKQSRLGEWVAIEESLYLSRGEPRWLEHPKLGRKVDVVAIPIDRRQGIELYPYEVSPPIASDVAIRVAPDLSIIGFPFGITGGGLMGVWSRGTIATEPEINFDDLPLMLIDSRTRQGQSGSPVIFHASSGTVPMKNGGTAMFSGAVSFLVGVYSGRVSRESDLGLVWKSQVIADILAGETRATGESLMG